MDEFEDESWIGRLDAWALRLDELRRRPAVAIGAGCLVLVVLGGGWWLGRPGESAPVDDLIPRIALDPTVTSLDRVDETVVIHVAGAVSRPGVYTLPAGSRVLDGLEAAGGPVPEADVDQLNLAAVLVDGIQIRVPVEGEVLTIAPELTGESGTQLPVDINRASAAALEALPGVGPATAAAIVAHREEHGPFSTVDDLLNVSGIGPAKLEALRDDAIVS